MKRIFALMGLDMANALRDNIIIYMMIAPLLFALAIRIFFPSVESAGLNFAVEETVDSALVERLENYGRVELFADADAVRTRVERPDAVPGIILEAGAPTVLFEGNEPQAIIDNYLAVLDKELSGRELIQFEYRSVGDGRSLLLEYLIITVLMMTLFLGAVVPGFNLIHEKETQAIRALNISPLGPLDLVGARGMLATAIGLVTTIPVSLILVGTSINYLLLAMAILASALLTSLLCLIIGCFADNQITAIAVLKLVIPLYLGLPVISLFIPERLQFLFYPLPNYWQFEMFRAIFIGEGAFWPAAALTLAISAILFLILTPALKNKLKLR